MRLRFVAPTLLSLFAALSASAQFSITTLTVDGKEQHKTEALQIHHGKRPDAKGPFDVATKPEQIVAGDVVTAARSGVVLRALCGKATTLNLTGHFVVVVQPPGKEYDCAVAVSDGTITSQSTQPTNINAGGMVAVSRSTFYSVRVSREGANVTSSVDVFEGTVDVSREMARQTLRSGQAIDGINNLLSQPRQISPEEIASMARTEAELDVAAAIYTGHKIENRSGTIESLTKLHRETLANPANKDSRSELAKQQQSLGLKTEAAYQTHVISVSGRNSHVSG
jgi:hypothetical protein